MEEKYKDLFTPWKIGNCEIKNRIVLCPMGGTSLFGWMEPHHFDKDAASFFMDLAKNNVGLIIPGIAPLRNMMGGSWLYKANGAFKKLKPYMEEIHKYGAKLFVQLTAGFGRAFSVPNNMAPVLKSKVLMTMAKPIFNLSYLMASPSKLPSRWADDSMCRPLTKKEIEKIIYAYAKTAKKCKDAGVDGVEVHAVHEGYLIDQFTTKYTNNRTDEYGGSFENRYRFPVEIVKAIKKECGEDFPVSVRYSAISKTKGFQQGAMPGEEYIEVGRDMEESKKAVKYLEDAGYDMLNTDNGTYDAWYWAHPPAYMPTNCNLEDVATIRKYTNIPVVCAGKMTPYVAAQAIKDKKIDAMGVARQFLVDPHWVTKLLEDKENEIQPCIYCHNGCFPLSKSKSTACTCDLSDSMHMARCALNPMTMDGGKYDYKMAKRKKNIAIVGGGIGGMEAARILTLRGHNVTIYEKSNVLGGVFIPASAPSFKEADKRLIDWYRLQIKNLNINVKLNTFIKDINELDADEIIIATGSTERKLNIKGFSKTISAVDYLNGKEVQDKVAVLGGGLTGCEIAYDLCLKGKHPIIIEAQNDLMTVKGLCLANSSYLRDYFKLHEVPVYLESFCTEIGDKNITIKTKDGQETKIDVDNVISAVGYVPSPLSKKKKHIYVIGDAKEIGNLRTVVWSAWSVAIKL